LRADQLAHTLGELKTNIDAGLAKFRAQLEAKDRNPIDPSSRITPNATTAIRLLHSPPASSGRAFSGDETRVAAARETMAELQPTPEGVWGGGRRQAAGVPARLAGLRKAPDENKPE
jgi:hypothetical protein